MALMEVEWHPTPRQLRVFGVSGLAASIVAAAILHWVWSVANVWVAIVPMVGLGIFLCSLISQTATRWLYVGLTLVAMPIGLVVSFLVLAAFYFLLLTPLALVFRLIGRDAMRRKYEP
ncbi:MAG: hypothetical protein ACM3VT_13440, partial [Solirubrobacterales bacterium]